jgi:hypothetical protein
MSATTGFTVRFFVISLKLMKSGNIDVSYKTTDIIIGLHNASTIGQDRAEPTYILVGKMIFLQSY